MSMVSKHAIGTSSHTIPFEGGFVEVEDSFYLGQVVQTSFTVVLNGVGVKHYKSLMRAMKYRTYIHLKNYTKALKGKCVVRFLQMNPIDVDTTAANVKWTARLSMSGRLSVVGAA